MNMDTTTGMQMATMTMQEMESMATSAMEGMMGMSDLSSTTTTSMSSMDMGMSMDHMQGMSGTKTTSMSAMHMITGSSMAMSGMAGASTMTISGMSGMSGMSGNSTSSMAGMGTMKMTCSMSMLWNWYTKDVCFISKQWKTSTKAKFGGTCVGVFALLLAINWWRRILIQYKQYCAELRTKEVENVVQSGIQLNSRNVPFKNIDISKNNNMFVEMLIPFIETWKHDWFWALNKNLSVEVDDRIYIYPSIFEHLIYCVGDTMEWSVHHVIMLLFMYFNGYVFISCMIGAGVGFMLFQYKNINSGRRGDQVSKRCCL
jgi:copper transporter 1